MNSISVLKLFFSFMLDLPNSSLSSLISLSLIIMDFQRILQLISPSQKVGKCFWFIVKIIRIFWFGPNSPFSGEMISSSVLISLLKDSVVNKVKHEAFCWRVVVKEENPFMYLAIRDVPEIKLFLGKISYMVFWS